MPPYRVDELRSRPPRNGAFYTVAIDGRGGAGKSALAAHLGTLLPDFVLLAGDDYFEPLEDQLSWGDFNDERFESDVVRPLQAGSSFTYRPYTWGAEPPVGEREISIEKGMCLERCFSFTLGLEWDLKIWVETPRELCLERGLARENGLPRDRVAAVWEQIWQPTEDDYIRKERPLTTADVVLDGTRPFAAQIV